MPGINAEAVKAASFSKAALMPTDSMYGTIIIFQNCQRFDLVESKPYIRKHDGKATKLLVFQSMCIACDRQFTQKTTMNMLDHSRWLDRRCKRCQRKEAKLSI